jgi:glycosyltransferase involved in cell wall biosynthesis
MPSPTDAAFRPCAVIPCYDNPATIRGVVERVHKHLEHVIVVDDASHEACRRVLDEIASDGLARVVRRDVNGGKGAAVKTGFSAAHEQAHSHVLQVDADGQHDLADVPKLLATAAANPEALVLGRPLFDETQPLARRLGRQLSVFFVHVETGGRVIADPQCGFRVYPLAAALAANARGERMEFDLELPVRMVWNGTPVINLPTRVRYLTAEEGGVSHFQMLGDNLRITRLHTRLVLGALRRRVAGR